MDIASIAQTVVAVLGVIAAVLTYLGKREEAKKVQAVVDGVEDAARGMTGEEARALKRRIQAAAATLGVQEALHATVKGREEARKNGG